MATTAIFAEILATGLLGMVWLVLAILSITDITWLKGSSVSQLKEWTGIITIFATGICYIFGILIDRIADSLLTPIDNYRLAKTYLPAGLPKISIMKLKVMHEAPEVATFLAYVRSRLRITRSASINIPLISIGLIVFLSIRTSLADMFTIGSIILGGILLTTLAIFAWFRISRTYYSRLAQAYNSFVRNKDMNRDSLTL